MAALKTIIWQAMTVTIRSMAAKALKIFMAALAMTSLWVNKAAIPLAAAKEMTAFPVAKATII
jgi:hypothetical protein